MFMKFKKLTDLGFMLKAITLLFFTNLAVPMTFGSGKIDYEQCGKKYVCTYQFVIKPKFDVIYPFYEGIARVAVNGKSGFINKKGKLVIKPKFDSAGIFSDGLAGVKVNGKWGFVNKKGQFVIKPKFDLVGGFLKGMVVATAKDKSGFVNKKGQFIIRTAKFDVIYPFFLL